MSQSSVLPFCRIPDSANVCLPSDVRKMRPPARLTLDSLLAYQKIVTNKYPALAPKKKDAWDWEVFCVHWNLANLWAQRALKYAPVSGSEKAHAFDQAARAVRVCLEMYPKLQFSEKAPRPRLLANHAFFGTESFLTLWKAFLEAQTQRVMVCKQLIPFFHSRPFGVISASEKRNIPDRAAGAASLMEEVAKQCREGQSLWHRNSTVQTWNESAQGWGLLFRVIADYFCGQTLRDSSRLQQAEQNLYALRQLSETTAPSIKGLVQNVEPSLRKAITETLRQANTQATRVVTPTIPPCYYIPLTRWHGTYTRDLAKCYEVEQQPQKKPKTAPEKLRSSGSKSPPEATPGERTRCPENPLLSCPFDLKLSEAKAISKHLLVVLYGPQGNSDSTKLEKALNFNQVIREILLEGFLMWEGKGTNAEKYIASNAVTQFPHVAIWEPLSTELVWRCDGWDTQEDPLLEERLAEAALSYGSYNPYEGLETKPAPSPIRGNTNPPASLVFTAGGFRAVLEQACATRKWVLVNLQCDSLLASHELNRDVWHNSLVEDIVRENFVFWQKLNVAVEGRVYGNLFQVKAFPHVAILDPFTGRIVWRKEGWSPGGKDELTANAFSEAVVGLPELTETSQRASLSRQSSGMVSEGEKSCELLSLLDAWERLSTGTGGDSEDVEGDFSMVTLPETEEKVSLDIPSDSGL